MLLENVRLIPSTELTVLEPILFWISSSSEDLAPSRQSCFSFGSYFSYFSILKDTKPGVAVPDLPKDAGEASVANLDGLRHNKVLNLFL